MSYQIQDLLTQEEGSQLIPVETVACAVVAVACPVEAVDYPAEAGLQ